VDWIHLAYGSVTSSYEHGNEPSVSTKCKHSCFTTWEIISWSRGTWFMVSIGQYLVQCGVVYERWTGKDFGGSDHGTVNVISRYMPGATEEQYKIVNQCSWCPGSESTQAYRTEVQLAPWISKIWCFSQKCYALLGHDVILCLVGSVVSEEYSASIFRAGLGRSTFLRNIGTYLLVYMTSHPRKQ